MKNLLSILLFIPYIIFSQECMPCEIIANPNMEITKVNSKWPDVKNKSIVKINSLTKIIYQDQDDYWERYNMRSWWMRDGHDPWTEDPVWGDGYKKPDLNFNLCVNDNYRWKCGYSYVLRLPENFKKNKRYPLVIFLHGGVNSDTRRLNGRIRTVNSFYIPKNDQYIIASPIKLGIDWSAKKIQDMINEIKKITKLPFANTGAIAFAADSIYLRSGFGTSPLFSIGKNGVGTAIKNASAGTGIVVARSNPSVTAACTNISRSGSTIWI